MKWTINGRILTFFNSSGVLFQNIFDVIKRSHFYLVVNLADVYTNDADTNKDKATYEPDAQYQWWPSWHWCTCNNSMNDINSYAETYKDEKDA